MARLEGCAEPLIITSICPDNMIMAAFSGMTPYHFGGGVPELFLNKTRGLVCWMTLERVWTPTHGKWMIDNMPTMLCGSVMFLNRHEMVSGEIARFGLQ